MEQQVHDVAHKYLQNVRPSGDNNLRATCPFCGSSRAFIFSQDTGLWICFSCGLRGALAQLLYKLGLTREQVSRIVQTINTGPEVPEYIRRKSELKEDWDVLPEYVLSAYDECPIKMLDIGFSMEFLQDHDIGYDRVEDRITFPIRDYKGRLIGVSGRAYTDRGFPRYKVYGSVFEDIVPGYKPHTKHHLYGFHEVYASRYFSPDAEDMPLIIVEGYKACLWLKQMGFTHTVALQGSTLSKAQKRALDRIRGPKYVFLDNEPGKAIIVRDRPCAAVKIAERLFTTGQTYICQYEEGEEEGTSPDDLSKEQVVKIIQRAKTPGQISAHKNCNTQYDKWRRR